MVSQVKTIIIKIFFSTEPLGGAITLNIPSTVIPFIKIEEKEYGCSNKQLVINEGCTAV